MKKDRAVVFTVSNNLVFAVASVLMDLKHFSPSIADEIVIFHNGIQKKDQELLKNILLIPIRFINYSLPYKDSSFIPNTIIDYFTCMVFAKFECLRLLNEYKNILLLDYDIVIQKDISELFDKCKSGIKMMRGDFLVRQQLKHDIDDYDMEVQGTAAGTFVFQDHMGNYNEMYTFCYQSLMKYANVLSLPEQAIFDFMIQDFQLNVETINIQTYSPHPTNIELATDARIIHAYGQPKFWNGLYNKQWDDNYKNWLLMGGAGYKKDGKFKHLIRKFIRVLKHWIL